MKLGMYGKGTDIIVWKLKRIRDLVVIWSHRRIWLLSCSVFRFHPFVNHAGLIPTVYLIRGRFDALTNRDVSVDSFL